MFARPVAVGHDRCGTIGTVTVVTSSFGGWFAGALSDRFGRVRMLQIAILWYSVFTFLCSFAQNFEQLFILRSWRSPTRGSCSMRVRKEPSSPPKKAQYPSAEESQRARFRNHRESREQPVRLGVETCGEVEDVGAAATGAAAPEVPAALRRRITFS